MLKVDVEKVWRWDGYKKVWESMLKVEDEKVGSTVIPLSI
jgi:hypothetical protein